MVLWGVKERLRIREEMRGCSSHKKRRALANCARWPTACGVNFTAEARRVCACCALRSGAHATLIVYVERQLRTAVHRPPPAAE